MTFDLIRKGVRVNESKKAAIKETIIFPNAFMLKEKENLKTAVRTVIRKTEIQYFLSLENL